MSKNKVQSIMDEIRELTMAEVADLVNLFRKELEHYLKKITIERKSDDDF
jgi:hypothetical protein